MPTLPTRDTALSRRAALAGVVVGASTLWAGCTADDEGRPAARRRRRAQEAAEQDPDVAVAAEALAGEQLVLDAVTATTARHPDLVPALSPVLDAHRAHVSLLADAVPDPGGSGSPGATAAPSDVPSGAPDPFRVPRGAQAALRRLSTLEQGLSADNKQHAFAAQSGAFARLLASMAASAAQHALVLEQAAPSNPVGS